MFSAALETMPKDFVIRPFLIANKADVKHMILTEYKKEEVLLSVAEEHEARGKVKGTLLALDTLVQKGRLTLEDAAEEAGMTVEEFQAKVAELKQEPANA